MVAGKADACNQMAHIVGVRKHVIEALLLVWGCQVEVVLVAQSRIHLHLVGEHLALRLGLIYVRLLLRLLELQNCSVRSLVHTLSLVLATGHGLAMLASNHELTLLNPVIVVNVSGLSIVAGSGALALVVMALLAISTVV